MWRRPCLELTEKCSHKALESSCDRETNGDKKGATTDGPSREKNKYSRQDDKEPQTIPQQQQFVTGKTSLRQPHERRDKTRTAYAAHASSAHSGRAAAGYWGNSSPPSRVSTGAPRTTTRTAHRYFRLNVERAVPRKTLPRGCA